MSSSSSSVTSPTYSMSGGNSSGMSASSSPVILTPQSAPPGLPLPEDKNPAKLSWADEVEEDYYYIDNQKAPSTLPPLGDYNPPVSSSYPAEHPEVAANLEGKLADLDVCEDHWGYVAEWGQDVTAGAIRTEAVAEEESGSLWDDYEEEQNPPKSKDNILLCTDHGRICKKGICGTYSKQLAMQKRAENAAKASRGKGKKGRGRGQNSGSRNEQANNWRDSPNAGGRGSRQAPLGTRSANGGARNLSSSSAPLNTSSADDDDRPPVASSSKEGRKGRTKSNGIESDTASCADGWGTFDGPSW